jgi:hypothetical protein
VIPTKNDDTAWSWLFVRLMVFMVFWVIGLFSVLLVL